jgi:hypothetical protein
MFRKLAIMTAVSGMMISGVFAQAQPLGPAAKETVAPASSVNFITSQSQDQWVFTKFKGTDVVGPDDAKVGSVSDLLFDRTGKIIGVVVGVGGFLGIGAKTVAMDMNAFDVVPPNPTEPRFTGSNNDPTHVKLKVSWTKDQLKEAPNFVYFEPTTSPTTGSASPPTVPAP